MFEHNIIADSLSHDEACSLEIQLIKQYKTQDREYGYNILEGGSAPSIPAEVRQKMSIAMMGNQNGKGIPCSAEKAKKIGDAQRGRKFTEDHKRKLSEAKRGKSHASPSAETRKKISDKHDKKMVVCVETGPVYDSIHDCAKKLGILATSICAVCRGRCKSTHGLTFKYYDNE